MQYTFLFRVFLYWNIVNLYVIIYYMEHIPQDPFFDGDMTTVQRSGNSRYGHFLYESSGSPEAFIRSSNLDEYDNTFGSKYINWSATGNSAETLMDVLTTGRMLFKELKTDYGINSSGFSPIIGSDAEGQPAGFILSHRVHGTPIVQIEHPSQETSRQFDELGAKVAGYFQSKFLSDELCLIDLRPPNFMYGTLEEDTDPSVYLVDMDPLYMKIGATGWTYGGLKQPLDHWCGFIASLGSNGEQSIAAFNGLLDVLAKNGDFETKIPAWREQLEGRGLIDYK